MAKVYQILKGKGDTVFSVSPETTIYEALELMFEKNIGALLVMENEQVAGIFTERDYARKVVLKGLASKETLIRSIMTEDILNVSSDTSIEECMWIMTNRFIRHLPVVDNGKLVGLISIGDVVKHTIEEQKAIIKNLEHYITGNA